MNWKTVLKYFLELPFIMFEASSIGFEVYCKLSLFSIAGQEKSIIFIGILFIFPIDLATVFVRIDFSPQQHLSNKKSENHNFL